MNFLQASNQPLSLYFLLFVLAVLAIGTLLISFFSRLIYREKKYIQLSISKRLFIALLTIAVSGSCSAVGIFYLSEFLTTVETW